MEQIYYSESHNKSEGQHLCDTRRDSLNTYEEVRIWSYECDMEKVCNAEQYLVYTLHNVIISNTANTTILKGKLVQCHKCFSVFFDITLPDKELETLICNNPEK